MVLLPYLIILITQNNWRNRMCIAAFTISTPSSSFKLHPLTNQRIRHQKQSIAQGQSKRRQSLFMTPIDNESSREDDDGWGNADDNVKESTSTARKSMNERELASLRSQMDGKRNTNTGSQSRTNGSVDGGDQERDLFIPIFAVVSLLGLFGAYGYEMLRLYSRGELYLPGM